MDFAVTLRSFRCFASVRDVKLAPITVLVGENSTGKTSFLAAVRRLIESFSFVPENAFNREPYFLGSFEQIAHYRGGKAGRAKEFTLEIAVSGDDESENLFSDASMGQVRHSITFKKGQAQPEIARFSISAGNYRASVDLTTSRTLLSLHESNRPIVQQAPIGAGASIFRRDPTFLSHYLSDLIRRESSQGELPIESKEIIRSLAQRFLQERRRMQMNIFASAPVRIQPRRVYTPSELTSSNAGEQIPLQMANQKLISPAKWKITKAKLIEFGSRAGLFEDIEIKRFGRSDGDPFQLQVKNYGPAANIVDVGYGVSQALPLLYPLQSDEDYGAYLLQQPEVHLHPRAQAEFGSLISTLHNESPEKLYVIETHSDFIIDRLRAEVRAGNLNNQSLKILFFRKKGLDVEIFQIYINESGEIANYPENYREFFLREQARVLGI